MSKFLEDMAREAKVRIDGYHRERAELLGASMRIAELDTLIEEAQEEHQSLLSRLPKKEKVDDAKT